MRTHFAIQARLIERRGGKVIRDETRLGTATALEDAVREADRHVADGFTAWIYRVESGAGPTQTYKAVEILRPDPGPVPRSPGRARPGR